MECLLPYLCMVTVPHVMVGLERMLDYRGVGIARFHCIYIYIYIYTSRRIRYIPVLLLYLGFGILYIIYTIMHVHCKLTLI